MPKLMLILTFVAVSAVLTGPAVGQDLQGPGLPGPEPDHEALLKNPDGSWKYTNRLIDSTSPYLLQHAHNPVDWYPWGPEALAAAREQDKPIFLSVGYSTCYWCHVMEREVFSNPIIAEKMNELYINIKVDREQRPDVDQIYMAATQLVSGGGGWPNSLFLTPDLKPFWAATYIGPDDIPGPPGQQGQPGFLTIIQGLHGIWTDERERVIEASEQLAGAISEVLSNEADELLPVALSTELPEKAAAQLAGIYDPVNGGFGTAPKFPNEIAFEFLFRLHERTGDEATLGMAIESLRRMASGGIHDHVGGGFHRYSTDAQWRVPHFEKMLYNQAQLARAYARAHEVTGEALFAETVHDIFRYVDRRMSDPSGAFYSALDAETNAVEGDYYVWNRGQIEALLTQEQLALFDKVFLLAEVPVFPGHKHADGGTMCMVMPLAELAASLETTEGELSASISPILGVLKEDRSSRELPRLDDKAIVAWNALMIDAYAVAGRVLESEAYTSRARRGADFILETMLDESGRLKRIWRAGAVSQDAFLEDYAFLADALITLHETTGEEKYLEAATRLVASANEFFWDDSDGGYFFTGENENLIARGKNGGDLAVPSGNAVMAHVLLDLAALTGEREYAERADRLLTAFSAQMARSPAAFIHMVHAVERSLAGRGEEPAAPPPPAPPVVELPAGPFTASAASDPGAFNSSQHVGFDVSIDSKTLAPGETFSVTVVLDIDETWHVNANPASASYLIATTADVRSDLPVTVDSVVYPEGHEILLAGDPISVYESGAVIEAACTLGDDAEAGNGVLRVVVGFQACDDGSCLAPATTVLEIPVTIAPR